MNASDLDLLTLWIVHTHFADEVFFTTPRLLIHSPLPAAGKTTVLEHCYRLAYAPLQAATLSSPAMVARLLNQGMRTLLVDEAEKSLAPDRKDVGELLAVINSGYKRGATRPVLVARGNDWDTVEMPTFAPVAMAGISPQLPDDTRSRCVTMLLLPDPHGAVEDSDWEFIEPDAIELAEYVATVCSTHVEQLRAHNTPELPEGTRGRAKEKWRPLKRIADMAGGRWPEACWSLIEADNDRTAHDLAHQLKSERTDVALLRDIASKWPLPETQWATDDLADTLRESFPERWGTSERYARGLTVQRVGRILAGSWNLRSNQNQRPRGYLWSEVSEAAIKAGLLAEEPADPSPGTGKTGVSGGTGDFPRPETPPHGCAGKSCRICRDHEPWRSTE